MERTEEKNGINRRARGILCVVGAALLYSTGGLLIKLIPWNGMAINGARMLLSMGLLWLFLRAIGHRIRWNRWVFLGSLCFFGATALFTVANKLTTAANTIVLQFTAPIFLMLYMAIFLKKRPTRLDTAACAAVFGGVLCFFLDGLSGGGMLGNVVALVAGASYGGMFLLRAMPGGDAYSSVFWGSLWGVLTGLPFLFQESDFSAPVLLGIFLLGVFQVGLGYILLCVGLQYTPPVTACLITGIEPVLNPVLVAVFYREQIGPLALLGAVIVVGGVLAYNVLQAVAERKPAEGH